MKLPRTYAALQLLLNQEYNRGCRVGADLEAKRLKEKEKSIHLDALKQMTQLLSVAGQAAGELARAMQSEKGQL